MVARVWTARQNVNYNAALDLMKQPPAGVRFRVFRPLRPLPVGSFTVEPKQIAAALALGHDEALQQMSEADAKPMGDSVAISFRGAASVRPSDVTLGFFRNMS